MKKRASGSMTINLASIRVPATTEALMGKGLFATHGLQQHGRDTQVMRLRSLQKQNEH